MNATKKTTKKNSQKIPKLGLALGGGGAHGLAHIGVLKVLSAAGIKIDFLAGTSMGGLVAALFAAGLPADEIERIAVQRGESREMIRLVDIRPSMRGLVRGGRIYNFLAETLGAELTFADLRLPTSLVAVDVNSGREVVLNEGKVVDAVRATISIPGVFVPVMLGPYKLVDGGVLNNVPVDVVRAMGADRVIAVDVLPHFPLNQPGETPVVEPLNPARVPKAAKDITHILMIMISAMTAANLQTTQPDLVIRPDLAPDLDILLSFDRPMDAINGGEKAAREALPRIQEIISGF